MNVNNKGKRPPPLPSFGNSKIQPPKKDDQMQKKLDSFFTELSKQSVLIGAKQQSQPKPKEVQQKVLPLLEKQSSAPTNVAVSSTDKKKLSLASINSKLNTMLTSKKINLNIGASKSIDAPKSQINNQQKTQKKRSEIQTEYDPNCPNNFDFSKNYYTAKFAELQQQSDEQQEKQKASETKKIVNVSGLGMRQLIEEEVDQTNNEASIAQPQQSEALQEKQQIALRMMQKFGYKVGSGLGKQSQGITTPLTIKKTTDTSCVIQQSSINLNQIIRPQISARNALLANNITVTEVIVLTNLLKMQQLTDEVQKQLKEECSTFGEVKKWMVYLLKNSQGKEQLRIFVEYASKQSAFNAFLKLNNRYYNENLASIRFYSKQEFEKYNLSLAIHPHVQT